MGWGDELIAAGEAQRISKLHGNKPVIIRDRKGSQRDHALWVGNPSISRRSDRPAHDWPQMNNGAGVRPYIVSKSDMRWQWCDFKCTPATLYFNEEEIRFAAQFSPQVIVEPNMKPKASPNKIWGRARWEALIKMFRDKGATPYQLGETGTQLLPGAKMIYTPSFRHACAVLARARVGVFPEGGLHHAAAAVGLRSVVIYGGYISPAQTGYDLHVNFFTGGTPCGMRTPCKHCSDSMAKITPEAVLEQAIGILNAQ